VLLGELEVALVLIDAADLSSRNGITKKHHKVSTSRATMAGRVANKEASHEHNDGNRLGIE
jgi:hypothetical protein